jgi:hypothetical protein
MKMLLILANFFILISISVQSQTVTDSVWLGVNDSTHITITFLKTDSVGTYTAKFDIIDTCQKHKTIILKASVKKPIAHAGDDIAICYNQQVRLGKEATSGSPPYSYKWSPESLLQSTDVSSPMTRQLTASAQFRVEVTDSIGCSSFDTVNVTVNPELTASVGPDAIICYGGSANLSSNGDKGTPPFNYQWSPNANISNYLDQNPTVFPNKTTTYTVTVTDSKFCKISRTVLVTVHPKILINLPKEIAVCKDSSIQLQTTLNGGAGKYTKFSWSPATGLDKPDSLSPNFHLSTPGTYKYYLTVTDSNNCTQTDSTSVRIRTNPTISLSKTLIDYGSLDACTSYKDDSLEINNTGNEDIAINNVPTPIGFVLKSPSLPFTVKKGEKKTIVFEFSPKQQGNLSGTVIFVGDPCAVSQSFNIKGHKDSLSVTLSTSTIDFGEDWSCNSIEKDTIIYISNTGTGEAQIKLANIQLDAPYSIVSSQNDTSLKPNEKVGIKIHYKPTSSGSYNSKFLVHYISAICNDSLPITLSGVYKEAIMKTNLADIVIPDLNGCRSSTDTVINIQNNGTIDLKIVSVGPLKAFSTDAQLPLTIAAGDSSSLHITFTPDSSGSFTGTIKITYDACNKDSIYTISSQMHGISIKPSSDTIDFGELIYCNKKFIVLSDTILNKSSGGINGAITDYSITGDFVTSNLNTGDSLFNNQPYPFNIKFAPTDATPLGMVYGTITLTLAPCNDQRTIYLKGKKIDAIFQKTADLNFGTIAAGSSSTKVLTFTNTGNANITIDKISSVNAPFTIISPVIPPPVILKPGETLNVTVRYDAVVGTQTDSVIIFSTVPCTNSAMAGITGQGTNNIAHTVVYIKSDTSTTGDTVTVPLMIKSSDNLILAGVKTWDAKITFNGTVLLPTGSTPKGTLIGDKRRIDISGALTDTIGVLYNMKFVTALGVAECSDMVIDEMNWHDGVVVAQFINGVFCLSDICHQGGPRLLNSSGETFLFDCKPNPTTDKVTFEFETIEDGSSELFISDILGNKVGKIFEAYKAGKYVVEFNVATLNSGVYAYTLQTPTIRLSKLFGVIK